MVSIPERNNNEGSHGKAKRTGSRGGPILRQHRICGDVDIILRKFICLAPIRTLGSLSQPSIRHQADGLHSRLLHNLGSVARLGSLHLESVASSYPTAPRAKVLAFCSWHDDPSRSNRNLDLCIRAKRMVTPMADKAVWGEAALATICFFLFLKG